MLAEVSAYKTARSIYLLVRCDPEAIAEIRAQVDTLRSAIVSGDADMVVTSSTINGQSFSGQTTMTKGQRFAMLRMVLAMIEADMGASNTAIPHF
jgi:hypothetical protein